MDGTAEGTDLSCKSVIIDGIVSLDRMLRVVACDGARFVHSVEMLSGLSRNFSVGFLDFACFGDRVYRKVVG